MAKESMRKILIRGEFDEFPDDMGMHGTARMSEMLAKYSKELPCKCPSADERFLMEEIAVLEEAKGINGLPNFLPRTAFLSLLKRKVKEISHTPSKFVQLMWAYIEDVVVRVLLHHSENYPQLQSLTRRAAQNLVEKMRNRSYSVMKESIEMEMVADYTSNADYMKTWAELMNNRDKFMDAIENHTKPTKLSLERFGEVEVSHLRQHEAMAEQAFDMRMRITACWRSVVLRLVDNLALHILYSVNCLVEKEMEMEELVDELVGPRMSGLERILEESPSTAGKRERLRKSIELLKESKEVVARIMDRIESHGGD